MSINSKYGLLFGVVYLVLLDVTLGGPCNPWACRSLPCSEPVKLPGMCCPICPCFYKGQYFNVGDLVFTPNKCVTCECTKYGIECLPWPCPRPDCPNPVKRKGSCCAECGCMVRGYFIEMGFQVSTTNPCLDCRCNFDGKVRCTNMDCPPLDCERPYSLPGTCCKQCGCKDRAGRTYEFGLLPDADTCRPCTCQKDGQITCIEPNCPEIPCLKRNQYTPDGECCPKCGCTYKKQFYQPGPLPISDSCRPCTCQNNGTVTCAEPECPEITCLKFKQYLPEGECCPKCSCLSQKEKYKEGEIMPIPVKDKCATDCYCGSSGEIQCNYPACPVPECPNPVVPPNECCPKCGCPYTKNRFFEIGPLIDDPCQPCECQLDGNVTCGPRQLCPPLKCVSGFYKPGPDEEQVCCQHCKCRFAGGLYKPGELFEGPKCQRCECHKFTGRVSCEQPDCSGSNLQCANPVIKKGDCCPTCPDGPSCLYQKSAIPFGKYREFGKVACTCAGDPWFPNAFCAPKQMTPDLRRTFDKRWQKPGYPADRRRTKKLKI